MLTCLFEEQLKRMFPPTDVARVSLSDATLLYTDQQSGKALEAAALIRCHEDGTALLSG